MVKKVKKSKLCAMFNCSDVKLFQHKIENICTSIFSKNTLILHHCALQTTATLCKQISPFFAFQPVILYIQGLSIIICADFFYKVSVIYNDFLMLYSCRILKSRVSRPLMVIISCLKRVINGSIGFGYNLLLVY